MRNPQISIVLPSSSSNALKGHFFCSSGAPVSQVQPSRQPSSGCACFCRAAGTALAVSCRLLSARRSMPAQMSQQRPCRESVSRNFRPTSRFRSYGARRCERGTLLRARCANRSPSPALPVLTPPCAVAALAPTLWQKSQRSNLDRARSAPGSRDRSRRRRICRWPPDADRLRVRR